MDYWVFGDESGDFDFGPKGSTFFVVGTVTLEEPAAESLCRDLRDLRESLARNGIDHDGVFHASEDRQQVRDLVFPRIVRAKPRCDFTVLEKARAYPRIRTTQSTFYKYAWFFHLKYILRYIGEPGDCVHVVVADMGTKKTRAAFRGAVEDVLGQLGRASVRHELAFWKPGAHEGLQAVDYVLWAIARDLERGDPRSRSLIGPFIRSEYRLFG